MLFILSIIFIIKRVQYNKYFISTVDTDDLVLNHQGRSSYNAVYTPSVYA